MWIGRITIRKKTDCLLYFMVIDMQSTIPLYNRNNLTSNLFKQNSFTRRISRSKSLYISKAYQSYKRDARASHKRENIKNVSS